MILKYYLISMFALSYGRHPNQDTLRSENILNIEIQNGTNNEHIPKKIELDDAHSIELIVGQLNNLRAINFRPNVRANHGEYDMQINFKDKSFDSYNIIYTVYDGVIIQGVEGNLMNKYYKNNDLELLILSLFISKSSNE